MENIYCFDTSSFVESWSRHYPIDVFPSLWTHLDELVESGRIIFSKEVEKEILNGKDGLVDWIKNNKKGCKNYSVEQLTIVQEIVTKYPRVSQYNKTRPIHADPFVIALAKTEASIVVTNDNKNGSPVNPDVCTLCKEHGIKCMDMMSFLREEKLVFNLN